MRREQRLNSEDAEAVSYTFYFQMTSGGGRQACSVRVRAPNIEDARTFFRDNWPMIEPMARDRLASRSSETEQSNGLCLEIVELADLSRPPRDECQC
jgi:hypothetical protein